MQLKTISRLVLGYKMEIDFNNVTAFINGVGFPIAVCVFMLWYNNNTIARQQQLLSELKDIIRDNSEVMRDLVDEIKRGN